MFKICDDIKTWFVQLTDQTKAAKNVTKKRVVVYYGAT